MRYVLAEPIITKHHRLGSLNNRNWFSTIMELGKFKMSVPPWLGSWWGLSYWFTDGCLLVASRYAREIVLFSSSLDKGTNPGWGFVNIIHWIFRQIQGDSFITILIFILSVQNNAVDIFLHKSLFQIWLLITLWYDII